MALTVLGGIIVMASSFCGIGALGGVNDLGIADAVEAASEASTAE